MSLDERGRLINNVVASMSSVPVEIQKRQIEHFYRADQQYGIGVARGLGLEIENVPENVLARAGD
jgi:catalase